MVVQEMVYQFKLEAKRSDSTGAPDMPPAQLIQWLNLGQTALLMERYGPHNAYGATLEAIQKRIDEWQRLQVPHEPLGLKRKTDSRYEGDLTKTKKPYLFLLGVSFVGGCDACPEQVFTSRYSGADDLRADLDNPNRKPNFEWREVLHRLAEDKLLAYTQPDFHLTKADLDYLRYPRRIDLAGYTGFDGQPSQDVDCELPAFLHYDVVSKAVYLYKLGLNHPDVQAAALALQQKE